jgi:HK97 family phage prohead protease
MTIERRSSSDSVELREDNDTLTAIGMASVFNSTSQNLGGFVERVAPGAFTKTLQETDVRALFDHNSANLLGRKSAGTLRLQETERGLAYEVDIPETTLGRDIATLLCRGDLRGSSFGFRTISDSWGETADGYPLRTLNEVALREVSIVTWPAYESSEASLRSLAEAHDLDLDDVVRAAKADSLQSILNNTEPTETEEPSSPHSVGLPPSAFIR